MKAIILAGGRGSRMMPLSKTCPKPMLTIGKRPILEYTLSILPKEVNEVYIVVGWLGEVIKNHFGENFKGKRIFYIEQEEQKGTFHALNLVRKYLEDEPFLMMHGDDLYSAKDLKKISKYESAILVNKTPNPERFGICEVDEENYLRKIIEKPKVFCGNLANIGVYKLRPTIFNEDKFIGVNGEEVLAPMIGGLAKKEKIKVVKASFWFPLANKEDLERAQKLNL